VRDKVLSPTVTVTTEAPHDDTRPASACSSGVDPRRRDDAPRRAHARADGCAEIQTHDPQPQEAARGQIPPDGIARPRLRHRLDRR